MEEILKLARENGFTHFGPVNYGALIPLPEVREMCAADRCGKYGKSWSCPPACGTLQEASAAIARYSRGILVQTTGALSDPFDYDGMTALSQAHRQRFSNFARQVRFLFPDCLPLTAGACNLCKKCTYPGKPCRFPDKQLASMEAYGLFVSDICVQSGLQYNYGPNTLTYTSCVLFSER